MYIFVFYTLLNHVNVFSHLCEYRYVHICKPYFTFSFQRKDPHNTYYIEHIVLLFLLIHGLEADYFTYIISISPQGCVAIIFQYWFMSYVIGILPKRVIYKIYIYVFVILHIIESEYKSLHFLFYFLYKMSYTFPLC